MFNPTMYPLCDSLRVPKGGGWFPEGKDKDAKNVTRDIGFTLNNKLLPQALKMNRTFIRILTVFRSTIEL